ncbi:MAG: acyl-CoA thioesterase [Sedimentisphaerales bacterium]|nr:acyl-CoA thioesterase [Sedimentisphaerales bacterium]
MTQLRGKKPADSAVESRYLLMPNQANQFGTAFGGAIMAWIDMVAAMAAQKHCGKEIVTAGMDSLSFLEPVRVGEMVLLKAMVNYAGATSMEVGVQVIRDNPATGEQRIATTAHLTFVALDENKRPTPVPPILPETDEEKRRYANAEIRVQMRKQMRQRMGKKE